MFAHGAKLCCGLFARVMSCREKRLLCFYCVSFSEKVQNLYKDDGGILHQDLEAVQMFNRIQSANCRIMPTWQL